MEEPEYVTPEAMLRSDLELDSLEFVEILERLEGKYKVKFDDYDFYEFQNKLGREATVHDIVDYTVKLIEKN